MGSEARNLSGEQTSRRQARRRGSTRGYPSTKWPSRPGDHRMDTCLGIDVGMSAAPRAP